jgi:hypothetical protein
VVDAGTITHKMREHGGNHMTGPSEPTHTMVLDTWEGDQYLGEDFGHWDYTNISCPHQPPTEHMPCAMWEPCGCTPKLTESPEYDGGTGIGEGPCPNSKTGQHRYIDGEPNLPTARCWTRDWESSIGDRAFDLGLPAGTYSVRPWWDGDMVHIDLVDPLVVTQ